MLKGDEYLFQFSIRELKRLFKNAPFLEVEENFEKELPVIRVKSTEEFLDVCDKLNLLVEYVLNKESRMVRFSTSYQGRLLVNEISLDELSTLINRMREIKESVI
ncbi:hypothetical protein [Thermococcus sp.]